MTAQIILTSFEFNWNSNLMYISLTTTQRGFLLPIVVIQCGIRLLCCQVLVCNLSGRIKLQRTASWWWLEIESVEASVNT